MMWTNLMATIMRMPADMMMHTVNMAKLMNLVSLYSLVRGSSKS